MCANHIHVIVDFTRALREECVYYTTKSKRARDKNASPRFENRVRDWLESLLPDNTIN